MPKNDFTKKFKILTPLQKLPKNVGDLGKLIVAKGFEKLPKVQKIAKSGHTDWWPHISHYGGVGDTKNGLRQLQLSSHFWNEIKTICQRCGHFHDTVKIWKIGSNFFCGGGGDGRPNIYFAVLEEFERSDMIIFY